MPRYGQLGFNDQFFKKNNCDRCSGKLIARIMSWFNDETICINCSKKESEIKEKLRAQGKDPRSYEGCGYIPEVE